MKVLVLASKCPWPPIDGGRLALWQTLLALKQAGAELRLLAPYSAAEATATNDWLAAMRTTLSAELTLSEPQSWLVASLNALRTGTAVSLARHAHSPLAKRLPAVLADWQPDVIHAECLQSLAILGSPPWPRPVVLRSQNVESDLWRQWPANSLMRGLMKQEAARLQRDEQRLMQAAALSLAITDYDCVRLQSICDSADRTRVQAWTVPFPAVLPARPNPEQQTQIVLPGSRGWGPNQQAFDWAVRELAPALFTCDPTLRLTLFAPNRDARWPENVDRLPVPADSEALFPEGAIAALPLFAGSGIRMRILEAWARGLPVVATSIAARGLKVRAGEQLLIADDAQSFAAAIKRLNQDAPLRAQLIAAGRTYLRAHHDPELLGQQLLAHYRSALRIRQA